MMNPARPFQTGAALLLIGLAAAAPAPAPAPAAAPPLTATATRAAVTPIALSRQPRTWMDTAARRLTAQDLAEARRNREAPLLLVGAAKLSTAPADRQALFVQLQSPRECGSAGCSTQVFLWRAGQWSRVLDGVSGKLGVAATRTNGMADLITDEDHYAWNGTAYASTRPAPQIDLRPRR